MRRNKSRRINAMNKLAPIIQAYKQGEKIPTLRNLAERIGEGESLTFLAMRELRQLNVIRIKGMTRNGSWIEQSNTLEISPCATTG